MAIQLYAPRSQRWLALAVGFLGWMFAGMEISSFALVTRSAVLSMNPPRDAASAASEVLASDAPTQAKAQERHVKRWLAWYQATFLLGAAAGGWWFGWLGDRIGRARALGWSVLTYSVTMGFGYFATTPEQLLIVRTVSCLGVGGAWPNAVALVAESWPDVSRPLFAGLLGAAANFGFVLLGLIGCYWFIEVAAWRWVLLVCAAPAVLGAATLWLAPEPPRWLTQRGTAAAAANSLGEIFRPPYRHGTLLGIVLGAVPLLGTAVNAVWIVPWSEQAGQRVEDRGSRIAGGNPSGVAGVESAKPQDRGFADSTPATPRSATPWAATPTWLPPHDNPRAKAAWTQVSRSSGAILGSLVGGWIASLIGRRVTYFAISLASLAVSVYLYGWLDPALKSEFSWCAFALGLVGVTYFGWLPLYLPELFPTRIRATGTGVTFNTGRAVAAVAAIGIAGVITSTEHIDYARIGLLTSGVYAIGLVAILFAPDTSRKTLED